MQTIRLPQLSQPINGAHCTCGHLYHAEMRGGTLMRELWLYEDDHTGDTRRLFKVQAPVTPKGRVRQGKPTRLVVKTLKGFSQERQIWGVKGEQHDEFTLETTQANELLVNVEKLVTAKMDQYRNSAIWYRPF